MKLLHSLICLLLVGASTTFCMDSKSRKRVAVYHKEKVLGYVYRKCSECDPERYRIEDGSHNSIALLHVHVSDDTMKQPHVWMKFLDPQQEPLARRIVKKWNPLLKKEVNAFKSLDQFISGIKQRITDNS